MHAAGFAAFFLYLIDSADEHAGAADCFVAREAGANTFFHLLLEMEAKLVVELGFDGVTAKQGAQAEEKVAEHVDFLGAGRYWRGCPRRLPFHFYKKDKGSFVEAQGE